MIFNILVGLGIALAYAFIGLCIAGFGNRLFVSKRRFTMDDDALFFGGILWPLSLAVIIGICVFYYPYKGALKAYDYISYGHPWADWKTYVARKSQG